MKTRRNSGKISSSPLRSVLTVLINVVVYLTYHNNSNKKKKLKSVSKFRSEYLIRNGQVTIITTGLGIVYLKHYPPN